MWPSFGISIEPISTQHLNLNLEMKNVTGYLIMSIPVKTHSELINCISIFRGTINIGGIEKSGQDDDESADKESRGERVVVAQEEIGEDA
jgi:hypothetical protein